MTPDQARLARAYGYVFQAPGLYPWRTIAGNIALPLEIMGFSRPDRAERVARVLDLVELGQFGGKYPWQLSAGMILAVGIVHNRAMDMSIMPWAVASQTVPILAIAPMVIVVFASAGVTGLLPKAFIAAWLSFFPVLVGMVKGLRAPDAMQMDLMRSWNASPGQVLRHLRLPVSLPYLFASLKVAVAAALVGTIVGELPAGATQGLGARLLSGSYYGQTIQIWAALFAAAILAAALGWLIGLAERITLRRMGLSR